MLTQIESSLSSPSRARFAPALLRAALGTVFLAHAYAKAAVFTFPGTSQFFEANGFPGWTAYPVFAAELFGGLALLAGYRTRLVSLALIPVMLGAVKTHIAGGWMFNNPGGGWEYAAFLLVALAVQALLGDGALSLGELARSPASRVDRGAVGLGPLGTR